MRNYRFSSDIPVTHHEVLARLAEISHLRWVTPNASWENDRRRYHGTSGYSYDETTGKSEYRTIPANPSLPIEYSTTYGQWEELGDYAELKPDTFIIPDYCGGSDYSGNLVEASNHKVLIEQLDAAELVEGVDYISYHGGHGTFAVAIRAASLIETTDCESIIETLEGLADYPLIDESAHSELEMESQNEAWKDWGEREFQQELGKYLAAIIRESIETAEEYPAVFQALPCTEELADYCESEYDVWIGERAGSWCYQLAEFANEYWVNEEGSGSYLDMADVVKHGITRELHYPEGDGKRASLLAEVRTAVERGYMVEFWDNIARNLAVKAEV